MAIITRTLAHNAARDPDHLLNELIASAGPIGSTCTSVAITYGTPNDSIQMLFPDEDSPVDAAIDAVIAAHPVVPAGLLSTATLEANGSWQRVWSTMLAEGERAEIDADMQLDYGDANSLEPASIHFHGTARRRSGEGAYVANRGLGGDQTYGEIPQAQARLTVTDNRVDLEISARRSGVVLISGDVSVKRRIIP